MILCNSFSINMLPKFIGACDIHIESISKEGAMSLTHAAQINGKLKSIIGHPDIAKIVQNELQLDMDLFNRETFKWTEKSENLLVAQYMGERLPEGTRTLPTGSIIIYYLVMRK